MQHWAEIGSQKRKFQSENSKIMYLSSKHSATISLIQHSQSKPYDFFRKIGR